MTLPSLSLSFGGAQGQKPQDLVSVIRIILMLTVLSLAPAILIMMTSFTRIVVVLSFLRSALGTQQAPPNMVIISLALFLTGFVMSPVFEKAWNDRMTGAGSRAVVYEPHYEGSSIVLGPPGGKCSAHGTHTFTARAGHHLAEVAEEHAVILEALRRRDPEAAAAAMTAHIDSFARTLASRLG